MALHIGIKDVKTAGNETRFIHFSLYNHRTVHIRLKKLEKSNFSSHRDVQKVKVWITLTCLIYRKVASSRLSRLVAHFQTVNEGEF